MGMAAPSSPTVCENVGWIKYVKVGPWCLHFFYFMASFGEHNLKLYRVGALEGQMCLYSFSIWASRGEEEGQGFVSLVGWLQCLSSLASMTYLESSGDCFMVGELRKISRVQGGPLGIPACGGEGCVKSKCNRGCLAPTSVHRDDFRWLTCHCCGVANMG